MTLWKPKRIVGFAASMLVVAFCTYRMAQQVIADPKSLYDYAFLFVVAAALIAAATRRRSRSYIVEHPWTFRVAGVLIAVAGWALLAILVATTNWVKVGSGVRLALAPLFLGYMVCLLPYIARPNKGIDGFIRWMRE